MKATNGGHYSSSSNNKYTTANGVNYDFLCVQIIIRINAGLVKILHNTSLPQEMCVFHEWVFYNYPGVQAVLVYVNKKSGMILTCGYRVDNSHRE